VALCGAFHVALCGAPYARYAVLCGVAGHVLGRLLYTFAAGHELRRRAATPAYSNPGTQTQAVLEFCPRAVVFCPAAHSKHAVAPKLCWYVPWSQGAQTPPSSKVPGAHGKHA
jgi:hypothetical protein